MEYLDKYLNNKDMTTEDIIQLWSDTTIDDPWNLCSEENVNSLIDAIEHIKVFNLKEVINVDFGCGKMALLKALNSTVGSDCEYLGIDVKEVYNRLSEVERLKFSSLDIKSTTPHFSIPSAYWFINSLYYLYKDDKSTEKDNLKKLFTRLNSDYIILINSGFNYYPAMEVLTNMNYSLAQEFQVEAGNPNPDFCTTYRVKIFKKGSK